jgi:hypothetical protein
LVLLSHSSAPSPSQKCAWEGLQGLPQPKNPLDKSTYFGAGALARANDSEEKSKSCWYNTVQGIPQGFTWYRNPELPFIL